MAVSIKWCYMSAANKQGYINGENQYSVAFRWHINFYDVALMMVMKGRLFHATKSSNCNMKSNPHKWKKESPWHKIRFSIF